MLASTEKEGTVNWRTTQTAVVGARYQRRTLANGTKSAKNTIKLRICTQTSCRAEYPGSLNSTFEKCVDDAFGPIFYSANHAGHAGSLTYEYDLTPCTFHGRLLPLWSDKPSVAWNKDVKHSSSCKNTFTPEIRHWRASVQLELCCTNLPEHCCSGRVHGIAISCSAGTKHHTLPSLR